MEGSHITLSPSFDGLKQEGCFSLPSLVLVSLITLAALPHAPDSTRAF